MSTLRIGLYTIGFITELKPRTQNKLKIFDPITAPTAMSVCFLYAATAEAANSGNDVPMATIVRPISSSDKPKLLAKTIAPSTIQRPPK